MRRESKKRKRPSVLVEESPNSKSLKQCGQIEVQVERKSRHVDSRQSAVSGDSSVRTAKTAVCNRRGSSKVKELEEQLDIALQAKQELAAQLKEHKIISAQSTLKHLEEYFTCPL